MNSTNDCILGVLSGTKYARKYEGIESYLVSIERSGFKGRKVMIVWNIHPIAQRLLLKYGFEIIDVPNQTEAFFIARIHVVIDYLKDHYQEFRYIFWLDIKDLILQSDPSIWMEKHIGTNDIVAANECVTIEQEETNQLWAKDVLGMSRYLEIKDEEVINGGTWAGKAEPIMNVFQQVYQIVKDYKGSYPPCQVAINYVLRQPPFKKSLYIPRWSESFAACLHPMWSWSARTKCKPVLRDKPPILDLKTGLLYPGQAHNPKNKRIILNRWNTTIVDGDFDPVNSCELLESKTDVKPFAIVHGFDRDWHIRELVEANYVIEEPKNNTVSIFTPTHNSEFLPEVYKS